MKTAEQKARDFLERTGQHPNWITLNHELHQELTTLFAQSDALTTAREELATVTESRDTISKGFDALTKVSLQQFEHLRLMKEAGDKLLIASEPYSDKVTCNELDCINQRCVLNKARTTWNTLTQKDAKSLEQKGVV